MTSEERIAELLRAGGSRRAVAAEAGVSQYAVAKVRDKLGLPGRRPGPEGRSLDSVLASCTELVEPGGHLRWTGPVRKADRMPLTRYRAAQTTAYRLIWLQETGQLPEGIIRPNCDLPLCVRFEHLAFHPAEDLSRLVKSPERLAAALAARTEPVEPGGHLRWKGYANEGVPMLQHGGGHTTGYRFVWFLNTGQAPTGHVRPTCDQSACMRFEHLADADGPATLIRTGRDFAAAPTDEARGSR